MVSRIILTSPQLILALTLTGRAQIMALCRCPTPFFLSFHLLAFLRKEFKVYR